MGTKSRGKQSCGLNSGTPKKKMRRAQKLPLSPDRQPVADESTGNEALMELLLDMPSQMHAMEEHMSQHDQANCRQAQEDESVRRSSPKPDHCCLGSKKNPTPREGDSHVSMSVRRKLACWLKQARLLTESNKHGEV